MPTAENLPAKSIVATADSVYFKVAGTNGEPTLPWSEMTDGRFVNCASDEDVDDLIYTGAGRVLRVGDGA